MPRPSSVVAIQSSSSLFLCLSLALLLALFPRSCSALSDPVEVAALQAIKRSAIDQFNKLSNWVGNDPCGTSWTGITCDAEINGTLRITELHLLNMNLTGTLAPDLGNLTQLVVIDFMWNNITGSIPAEIGLLSELYLLLLNGNQLTGVLPPELGNLSKLNRIQIDQNYISGPVPTTFQNLNEAKHFHMNNNSLNGSIPPELGRLKNLVHLLLDNNALTGEIPPEISNISTLLIVQLDNNQFQGSIPSNFSDMTTLTKLSLRNCNLTGEIPSLQKWLTLGYLDVSHNQLTGQLPTLPDASSSITTLDFSYNQLSGNIPVSYYQLPILEILNIRDNNLDGNFTQNLLIHDAFSTADSVLIIDAQNNNLTGYTQGIAAGVSNITIRLYGNPACNNGVAPSNLCGEFNDTLTNVTLPSTGIPVPLTCACADPSKNLEVVYGLLSSLGECRCAYPLQVSYRLKSPGFAIFQPYEAGFQTYLSSGLNLSLYQVNVSSFTWESGPRLAMDIKLFPNNTSNSQFDISDALHLRETFVNWKIPDNNTFGPYEVLAFDIGYPYNNSLASTSSTSNGLSGGAIAGIVIGVAAFTAVAVAALMLIFSKRWRSYATKPLRAVTRHERIKVAGVKDFSFDELAAATKSFDTSVQIGQGGYGKVYRGVLADRLEVAIKRAQEGSLQGNKEFATEIELLSRVHHRNLLSLIGYCDDAGEQMLVYEFMPNGTLREHLNFGSTVSLDFVMRIQIALGTAKGILYLHTEANPPIFHRDIKTTNILLDGNWKAKVSDFGLSKLAPVADFDDIGEDHVSTVVKGTPGYLDPEYFLTRKLTAKSDVYSFGVVLMELVTGMAPISQGRNLVREVNTAYDAGMILSIVDPRMGSYPAECLKPLVDLAVSCCKENTDLRPTMAEVVRQLEAIFEATPREYRTKTMAAVREGMGGETPPGLMQPYVSSDIDGSGLMSGTVLHVAPR